MKLISPYQYIQRPCVLFRNIWKTFALKYAKYINNYTIYFTTEENQSQTVRK